MKRTTARTKRTPPSDQRGVRRVTPNAKLLKTSIGYVERRVTLHVEEHLKSIRRTSELLTTVNAPIQRLIEQDRKAVGALKTLHKTAFTEQARRLKNFTLRKSPTSTTNFTFPPTLGFNVIVPPYDAEWFAGVSYADKNRGKMGTAIMDGFSAAALGVTCRRLSGRSCDLHQSRLSPTRG